MYFCHMDGVELALNPSFFMQHSIAEVEIKSTGKNAQIVSIVELQLKDNKNNFCRYKSTTKKHTQKCRNSTGKNFIKTLTAADQIHSFVCRKNSN